MEPGFPQIDREHEAEILAQLLKIDHANILFRVIDRKLKEERELLETIPKLDQVDVREDVRFKLGFINGLKWVLGRPAEAQDLLMNMNDRKQRR